MGWVGLGWVGLGWVKWGLVGSSHGKEKEKDKELERRALGKNLLDFKQNRWRVGVGLGMAGFGQEGKRTI